MREASKSQPHSVVFAISCFVVYGMAMLGVRLFARHIGLTGGLLTITAMLIAAHWYDRRQKRKAIEALPPDLD